MTLIGNTTKNSRPFAVARRARRHTRCSEPCCFVGARSVRANKRYHGHTTRKFEARRVARRTHPRNA